MLNGTVFGQRSVSVRLIGSYRQRQKRQMVLVCVLYCDCDLTALLYLQSEVCSCVQLRARLHK